MYKTVLIGLGRIASLNNKDQAMRKSLKYAAHAQVLAEHEKYSWIAGVDPSPEACDYVKKTWGIERVTNSINNIKDPEIFEIAVLAAPPDSRLECIKYFPSLKGVIVEKPLGESYKASAKFIEECNKRGIIVQVNLTRRSDIVMKQLASGDLKKRIGNVQFAFGSYGRGLRNYGIHLIDLVRMLIDEIVTVRSISTNEAFARGPLKGDNNFSFLLETLNGVRVVMQPLNFSHFREGSLDIWGEKGRIEIVHEGLNYIETKIDHCRSLSGSFELASDKRKFLNTGYAEALYNLYDNLADSLSGNDFLDSPSSSALKTELIVESLFNSADQGGAVIQCR